MPDGTEAIEDNEILYRRIPVSQEWYRPAQDPPLSKRAFRPRPEDIEGLSLSRAKYNNIEQYGRERNGRKYYVACLRAGDLREKGIRVVPDPIIDRAQLEDDIGHVLIPALDYDSRKNGSSEDIQIALATELYLSIEGPFPPLAP